MTQVAIFGFRLELVILHIMIMRIASTPAVP